MTCPNCRIVREGMYDAPQHIEFCEACTKAHEIAAELAELKQRAQDTMFGREKLIREGFCFDTDRDCEAALYLLGVIDVIRVDRDRMRDALSAIIGAVELHGIDGEHFFDARNEGLELLNKIPNERLRAENTSLQKQVEAYFAVERGLADPVEMNEHGLTYIKRDQLDALREDNERLRAVLEPGTLEARMEAVWTVAIKYGHSSFSSEDAIVFIDDLVSQQRAVIQTMLEALQLCDREIYMARTVKAVRAAIEAGTAQLKPEGK